MSQKTYSKNYMVRKQDEIYNYLNSLFPNASCELNYKNPFELLIAVILSRQTTDKLVNKVTKVLFEKYNKAELLKEASFDDVYNIIKPIGLARSKTIDIIKTSQILSNTYNSIIPSDLESLLTLPGVGKKTANVIRSEYFNIPSFAVDTHVERVSKRLNITKEKNILKIEYDLMNFFDQNLWNKMHLLLVLFGRYYCKAKTPECINCGLSKYCIK